MAKLVAVLEFPVSTAINVDRVLSVMAATRTALHAAADRLDEDNITSMSLAKIQVTLEE